MEDQMKKFPISRHHLFLGVKSFFWFGVGITLGLFFSISFAYIFFQKIYGEKIYPGVYINNINFGGKTEKEVRRYFDNQNALIEKTSFAFTYNNQTASVSAKEIKLGYNSTLLANQAYSIGRSEYILSDIVLVFNAYLHGVFLSPSYYDDETKLITAL